MSTTPRGPATDGPGRLLCLLSWGAGAMDAITGLGLVLAPARVMAHLGLPLGDASLVRFVGIFVFAVGTSYLLPFVEGPRHEPLLQRVVEVLRTTAWVRLCVATFLAVSMVADSMPVAWLPVCLADGALALVQFRLTRPGRPALAGSRA